MLSKIFVALMVLAFSQAELKSLVTSKSLEAPTALEPAQSLELTKHQVETLPQEKAEAKESTASEPSCPAPGNSECPEFEYDAIYDLKNNMKRENEFVEEIESLTGECCATRGVLKFAMAESGTERKRVLVDLFFDSPTGFSFNLGDSPSNDGFRGDSSHRSYDAEVHSSNSNMVGYDSDLGVNTTLFSVPFSNRLSLIAGDGHLVFLTYNGNDFNRYNYFSKDSFFALNGQADAQNGGNPSYDLYLGMNRVIREKSTRTGTGLCKVGIKFLPEI